MSTFVVDASVAAKWFLQEPYSSEARLLLKANYTLLVPDLLYSEVGNSFWKRVRKGEISATEASEILTTLCGLPLAIHKTHALAPVALEIACMTGRSVYDSIYLALAIREEGVVVTADERFYNALANTPLSSKTMWVASIPGQQNSDQIP